MADSDTGSVLNRPWILLSPSQRLPIQRTSLAEKSGFWILLTSNTLNCVNFHNRLSPARKLVDFCVASVVDNDDKGEDDGDKGDSGGGVVFGCALIADLELLGDFCESAEDGGDNLGEEFNAMTLSVALPIVMLLMLLLLLLLLLGLDDNRRSSL